MKKIFRRLFTSLKWLIAVLIMLEIASFLAISLSNYWIYGQFGMGSRCGMTLTPCFWKGCGPLITIPAPGKSMPDLLAVRRLRHAGRHRLRRPHHPQLSWPKSGIGRSRSQPATMVNCGEDGFNSLMETKYLQKLSH